MDSILWLDNAFNLAALVCASFLLYGTWLCVRYGSSWSMLALAVPVTMTLAAEAAAAPALEEAMEHYEQGSYVLAEAKLKLAAKQGEARAQEILGMMYALGPQLYPGIYQNLPLAEYWLDKAARAGRPVARYSYCALMHRSARGGLRRGGCFDWVAETGAPAPSTERVLSVR